MTAKKGIKITFDTFFVATKFVNYSQKEAKKRNVTRILVLKFHY